MNVHLQKSRTVTATPRIAFFAGTMRLEHDGVTRVLYKLIEHLRLCHVPAVFFSPIVPPPEKQAVPIHQVPSVRFPFYSDYRLALPGSHAFERELMKFEPDIIHINSPCPLGYAAAHFGLRHGIPVVATYHTHFPSYMRYYKVPGLERMVWQYLRTLYSMCSRVLIPSQPILDELAAHGLNNLQLLPHGVDTTVFNPAFRSADWRMTHGLADKTVLLFAGRLVWEKDLRVLADAWRVIRIRHPRASLVIAGDGPARAEFQSMVPDAVFLGQIGGTALSTAFASSDIFVFPSTTETFGNVTLEAMASGVTPVCARKGGAAGIIEHEKTGLLAAPHNPGAFAEQIIRLLDEENFRTRLAARALRVAQNQTWAAVFGRLMETYIAIISGTCTRRAA